MAESDRDELQAEVVDWEPQEALFAGSDGLALLREIVGGAPSVMRPGGLLALEVGADQAERVVEFIERTAALGVATIHKDLAGKDRIVTASAHV